jgi:hypothetical protein
MSVLHLKYLHTKGDMVNDATLIIARQNNGAVGKYSLEIGAGICGLHK